MRNNAPYYRHRPYLKIKDEDLDIRPKNGLDVRKTECEPTHHKACEHLNLYFADGQLDVVCYNCQQRWRGIRQITKEGLGSVITHIVTAHDLGTEPTPEGMRSYKKQGGRRKKNVSSDEAE